LVQVNNAPSLLTVILKSLMLGLSGTLSGWFVSNMRMNSAATGNSSSGGVSSCLDVI